MARMSLSEASQQKISGIDPSQAVRLVSLFRQPGQQVCLQTFGDAPEDSYVVEKWQRADGTQGEVKKYSIEREGHTPLTGPVNTNGHYSLEQLSKAPFKLQNSSARIGVHWAPNRFKPDAKKRKAQDVESIAAIWIDLDGVALPENFPLTPTAIVESSEGKYHVYWAVNDVPLDDFPVIQKALAAFYGSDPAVHDLPRTMRLPGYWHSKKVDFLSRLVSTNEVSYTHSEVLNAWPVIVDALQAAEVQRQERIKKAEELRQQADTLRYLLLNDSRSADAHRRYGEVVLNGILADLLSVGVGGRNNTLNWSAYRIGQMVPNGYVDESYAIAELQSVAYQVGLEAMDIQATIKSGLDAGKLKPKDASNIKYLAGITKKPKNNNLAAAASRVVIPEEYLLPKAEDIPDPEGENGTFSHEQLLQLLGLPWPVVDLNGDKSHGYRLKSAAQDNLGYVAEFGSYASWTGKQWIAGGGTQDSAAAVEASRWAQEIGMYMKSEINHILALYSLLDMETKRLAQLLGAEHKDVIQTAKKAAAMEKAYYAQINAARATESVSRQASILKSARPLYIKPVSDFEPKPWVVGFQNGTWDNGIFREFKRSDHMLHLTDVEYNPDADKTDWYAVLDRITGGDTDLQKTLQDIAGYALSGASSLRILPWLYGLPGTGKGTFSEMLATLLGRMAVTVDPKLFAADAARERLGAAIWGKRVVLCSEAGNARLDAETLKTLSGGDRYAVRMLYAESFTARPTHLLLMVANDPPRVEAYDDALKDRVLAVPFNHRLDNGGPKLLQGQILEQLRLDPNSALVKGMASWALVGLNRVFQTREIHRAAVCLSATTDFWHKIDSLHDFWLEIDLDDLKSGIGIGNFRQRYEQWCLKTGNHPMKAHGFNKACRSVGLDQDKDTQGNRAWFLINPARFPAQSTETKKAREFFEAPLRPLASKSYVKSEPDYDDAPQEQELDFDDGTWTRI